MIQRVFTWAIAAWAKIPTGTISAVFHEAQDVVTELNPENLSGWQKLEKAVGQLVGLLPQTHAQIASTVVTIIVAAARLSLLIAASRKK